MSRLELARERLETALESLEKAAQKASESPRMADAPAGPDPRLGVLEAERQTLLARAAELEDELAALSSVSQEVEGRLDGAIGEIRAALAR